MADHPFVYDHIDGVTVNYQVVDPLHRFTSTAFENPEVFLSDDGMIVEVSPATNVPGVGKHLFSHAT